MSRPRRVETDLPADFGVTDQMRSWADAMGVPVDWETEKFMDHCKAKGIKWKDWTAAWRNWMRKSIEINRYKPRPSYQPRQGDGFFGNGKSFSDNLREIKDQIGYLVGRGHWTNEMIFRLAAWKTWGNNAAKHESEIKEEVMPN